MELNHLTIILSMQKKNSFLDSLIVLFLMITIVGVLCCVVPTDEAIKKELVSHAQAKLGVTGMFAALTDDVGYFYATHSLTIKNRLVWKDVYDTEGNLIARAYPGFVHVR